MRNVTRILLLALLILFSAMFIFSWVAGYGYCMKLFLNSHGGTASGNDFYAFLSPFKFSMLRWLLGLYTLLLVLTVFYFKRLYNYVAPVLIEVAYDGCTVFTSLNNMWLLLVLIMPLTAVLFYACVVPVNFDEALTYMWFTQKGIFSSIAYYPAPNNHIFHSVITNVTKHLPGLSPLMRLRCSSIIAWLLTALVIFKMLNRHYNKQVAIIITAVWPLLFMGLYYGYMSRGYALVDLFFVCGLYVVMNTIKRGVQHKDLVCFVLVSVAGFYTMPSFLYAFVMLNIVAVAGNKKQAAAFLAADTLVVVFVALLYAPVIIINGLDALVNNEYVAPLGRTEVLHMLPGFTLAAVREITGISPGWWAALLIISTITLVVNNNRPGLIMLITFIATPFLLVLAHSVIRYSRTFSYFTIMLPLLVVAPWNEWLAKIKPLYLVPVLIVVQLLLLFNYSSQIFLYDHYSFLSERVLQSIADNKAYYCDEPMFEIPLQLRLNTGGFSGSSFGRKHNAPVSADTINGYDYVIIRNELDRSLIKTPVIRTEFYRVY